MRVYFTALLMILGCAWGAGAQTLREMHSQGTDIQVSVFPNPATDDYVYVRFSEPLNAGFVRLHLYNIIGNELPVEAEVVNDHELRIRIKDLLAGYYLLGLREERTRFKGTYKFLKR
ncbi:MAG: hypothetical protein KatS3mg032_0478 [Cyclobacteriaceae bacterium]|nr:MAG: hypothetical protein KatS3mg032_0478 [Cyclobacteriaceae bacterium]